MPHGFDIADDLHDQLRGPVPPQAVAWVEQQTASRVTASQPLEGGQSAAVHRLTLDGHDDVILQRFVLDWIMEEPWTPDNEALVLRLLRNTAVPAPEVIAADPNGQETGVPAVLMTALPGGVVWDPPELDPWIDALIDTMTAIHSIPVAPGVREWEAYAPQDAPPAWTRHRSAWEAAISAYEDERPRGHRVFLHRDFHPGNILWHAGSVSGVVDWVSSCAGPAEEDVAHCRVNLARHHGQAVADRFLQRWLNVTDRSEYHPYWDLLTAVSMSGEDPDPRLDEFVAASAARL
ncbi:phosphotransferase family protein [Flexivirga caeni]|uniref:Aminoglycoside phosphotransferase family protein n=1 Tax=Flexivirga caeni TaxID=2294115 RepID=A0A3M9MHV5_9MICO|nr:aminoglycoside phosphotransferase family protein [Flexivirga caeni]RNI24765.1 aminoglycoside phosphotransferase family protein [Flexivirga caeni]